MSSRGNAIEKEAIAASASLNKYPPIKAEQKRQLKEQCQELNAFLLQKAMIQKIKRLLALATKVTVSDEKDNG